MNFLAHAYLSFGQPDLLVGNLITDFIRGSQKRDFPVSIQRGITLHYAIDAFTDSHPATLEAKEWLRPSCGRYCVVFLDLVYDHFLANDPNCFSLPALGTFTREIYQVLESRNAFLPHRFKRIFPLMKKYDWLYSYHSQKGIQNAFKGIYHRAKYLTESDAAYKDFLSHYDKLKRAYRHFMPEVTVFSKNYIAGF